MRIKKQNIYICARGVFWLNISKFKVNWCYKYCFKLFSNLRKEKELRQYHCRNSPKIGERKIKSRREKFLIFGNGIAAIPSTHTYCPGGCSKCECAQGKPNDGKKKIWQLWQCHCRKWEGKKKVCDNGIAEIEGINFWQLWQWHCRNRG